MLKGLFFIILLSACLLSCQKEFNPFESEQTRTDSTVTNDTIKAVVFEGPIGHGAPNDYYDSIVYTITATQTTISHYERSRILEYEEFIKYDNQQRVVSYHNEWNGTYRYCFYTYTGSGKIPTSLVDSTDDSDFFYSKFTQLSSAPYAGGMMHTFRYEHYGNSNPPEIDTTIVYFDNNGNFKKSRTLAGLSYSEGTTHYNSSGLVDSIISLSVSPAYTEKDSLWIKYTPHTNPLNQLSTLIFKNLAKYSCAGLYAPYAGYLTFHFFLDGITEAKFPSNTGFNSGNNIGDTYEYTPQLVNGAVKSVVIKYTDPYTGQSSSGMMRIY